MRIAFVTRQFPPTGIGGIGSYVNRVAKALADAGHEVTVVCVDDGDRRTTTVADGVRVERISPWLPRWLGQRFAKPRHRLRTRVLAAVSAFAAIRRLRPFDVIEAPEWKAQGLLLRFARRGAVVVHVHLPLELELAWNGTGMSRGARMACALERRTAVLASARTATTRQTTRFPDGDRWLPDRSVELVAPPVDLTHWLPRKSADSTAPLVLFVGRLERRKAPEDLIKAMGLLGPEIPGLQCLLVGRPMNRAEGPYDSYLRAVADAAGVDMELRDQVADATELRALFEAARVVAVPSLFETLSMVVLEALACARPVVMTDQVGAAELVGGVLPELVVPAADPEALATAIRPFLLDPSTARLVGEAGRRLVTEVASPSRVVASRVAVYRRAGGS